jgi:hypothetical protein
MIMGAGSLAFGERYATRLVRHSLTPFPSPHRPPGTTAGQRIRGHRTIYRTNMHMDILEGEPPKLALPLRALKVAC